MYLALSSYRHNGRTIYTSTRVERLPEDSTEQRKPLLPHTLAILRSQAAKRQPIGLTRAS